MPCERYKTKVENGISNMANVNMAVADVETGTLKIYGNPESQYAVKKKIEELGYRFTSKIEN